MKESKLLYLYFMLLFMTICSIFFCGCNTNKNREIENIVKQWSGKRIIIPDLPFLRYGEIEVNYELRKGWKIVSYTDSVGCTTCNMNLLGWNSIIEEIYNKISDSLQFIFITNSDDINKIRYITRSSGFDLPICVDKNGLFGKLNNINLDYRFSTFLLNENNEVVAIGNPTLYPSVNKLYIDLLKKNLKINSLTENIIDGIRIYPDKIIIKHDVVNPEGYFEIQNNNDEPVSLLSSITSCDCIELEFENKIIEPHSAIRCYYHLDKKRDSSDYNITIEMTFSNSANKKHLLTIINKQNK